MATRRKRPLRWFTVGMLVAGGCVEYSRLRRRFRHDLEEAEARLAAVERRTAPSEFGPIEYAERGTGDPLLVIHGILMGCDGGLWSIPYLSADHRVIAPSRFGYLGSALPAGATPEAQADAYARLLDHLGIAQVDVVGISAGTSSTLQFALRHPDRVKHLVIVSGNWPGNPTAVAPPQWSGLAYADGPMWMLKVFARPLLNRLMGVPPGFPHNAEEAAVISELTDYIFPVGPRSQGARFDAFVSNPAVNSYSVEELVMPTLVVHAQDDPLTSYDAALRAAKHIPRGVMLSLESGGHLGLGQSARTEAEIREFLASPSTR